MTDINKVNAVKSSRPMRIFDIVIIALISLSAVVLSLTAFGTGGAGNRAAVTFDGRTEYYELSSDRTIKLETLTVVIEDGFVYVRDSECGDKICERSGKINKVNQSIVCLPAGVIVMVVGESDFQVDTGQEK